MKWRILFVFLFIASFVMMFVYSRRHIVEITITTPALTLGLNANGEADDVLTNNVKRQIRDDYTAVGMVIGFAIIAGASLIAIAFTVRDKTAP